MLPAAAAERIGHSQGWLVAVWPRAEHVCRPWDSGALQGLCFLLPTWLWFSLLAAGVLRPWGLLADLRLQLVFSQSVPSLFLPAPSCLAGPCSALHDLFCGRAWTPVPRQLGPCLCAQQARPSPCSGASWRAPVPPSPPPQGAGDEDSQGVARGLEPRALLRP